MTYYPSLQEIQLISYPLDQFHYRKHLVYTIRFLPSGSIHSAILFFIPVRTPETTTLYFRTLTPCPLLLLLLSVPDPGLLTFQSTHLHQRLHLRIPLPSVTS